MPAYTAADLQILLSTCQLNVGADHFDRHLTIDDHCWRRVLDAAVDHGLTAQFYAGIQDGSGGPAQMLAEIHSAFLAQACRNLHLTGALFEILPRFRACGVEFAVMKGAAVALLAFKQVTTREFTDLDLLVRPQHIDEARIILHKLGYRQFPNPNGKPHSEKDIVFIRESDQVMVELHWALNPTARRFPLEANGIWTRLQTVSFQNERIPTLGLEDTFLSLCIHGSVHGWTSLKWVYDVAQLITVKGADVDWTAVIRHSTATGCLRTVLVGVQLAVAFFNAPVPNQLTAHIAANLSIFEVVEAMRVAIVERRPLGRPALAFCHIRLHDHMWDRLLVAYHYLPDMEPITTGPSRYVIRPVQLLKWYGVRRLCRAIAAA